MLFFKEMLPDDELSLKTSWTCYEKKKKINFQFLVFRFLCKTWWLSKFIDSITVTSIFTTWYYSACEWNEGWKYSDKLFKLYYIANSKYEMTLHPNIFFVSLNNPLQPLMLTMILNIHLGQLWISWAWLFFIFAKGHYC